MKRQRSSSSSKSRASASSAVSTPTDSPVTDEPAPPPPKKVMRRAKVAPPTTLGSLPLYGEKLPDGGYSDVPTSAREICSELKELMSKVKELKQSPENKVELEHQKRRGMVLFASLKRFNRLSHLYCKDTREQTHEQKLEVDDLHLQLQNLMYEAMHLRKEITSCLKFKSQHEEIDLLSEAEFYRDAPESVSRPEVSRGDEHQQMLCRLEWELEQRKELAKQQCELEEKIAERVAAIAQREDQVSGLQPALETLRKATLPLQNLLGMPLDRLREEQRMATLLPPPLYVFYMQARAYAEVEDKSLSVTIEGDITEATMFQSNGPAELSDEDSGDSDGDGGKEADEGTHRKKRKRKTGKSSPQEKKDVSKAHPLSVVLTFNMEDTGSFSLNLSFVPNFSAVCASVTSLTFKCISDAQQSSIFLEKSAFLHCLFDGDTGRTSPNSIISFHIRKLGGDKFSSAVRQYGFPYKWVQRVCGIIVSSEMPEGVTSVQPQVETSVESLGEVVKALEQRFLAQLYLSRQILALDEHKLSLAPDDDKELFAYKPESKLIRWKYATLAEVQGTTQFARLSVFSLQERTNRFFVATLQTEKARVHALVRLAMDYPRTPPCFVVKVEPNAGQRELQTKNIEAEVNVHFPQSLEGDENGQYLLSRQLRRLQECFEVYTDHQSSTSARGHRSKQLHRIRGKGRLLVFDESL